MSAHKVEYVEHGSWDKDAFWDLRPLPFASWDEVADAVAREIAKGEIIGRYSEVVRMATRITVIRRHKDADTKAALIVDNEGYMNIYPIASEEEAHRAARELLKSGTAYNW